MPRKSHFGELSKTSMIGIVVGAIVFIIIVIFIYMTQSPTQGPTQAPITLGATPEASIPVLVSPQATPSKTKKIHNEFKISSNENSKLNDLLNGFKNNEKTNIVINMFYDTDYLVDFIFDYDLTKCDPSVVIKVNLSCDSRGYKREINVIAEGTKKGFINVKNIGLSGSEKDKIPFNNSEKVKLSIDVSNPKLDKNIIINNLFVLTHPV
jgi:hypothetical protein